MKHLLTAALITAGTMAAADCFPRDDMVDLLKNEYYLTMRFGGLSHDGNLIEIWVNESGVWIATATYPNGVTCDVSGGYAGDFFFEKTGDKL